MSEAIINISALRRNAQKCKTFSPLCAVVKANAYGLGSVKVAEALDEYADLFAVATLFEAEELADSGIKKDILVLGQSICNSSAKNVIHTVSTIAEIDKLSRIKRPRIAIKINTGMNRYGADPKQTAALVSYAKEKAEITSIYSHLRDASNKELSAKQLSQFNSATAGMNIPRHISATGGIALGKSYAFDFVRSGIGLYGGAEGFERVVTVTAPVIEVRNISAGEGIGYGSEIFDRQTRIAVIGIGYADGYRRLSAKRFVWINGKKREVIAVCMDVCFAAVDDSVAKDDIAEIIGDNITLNDLSQSYGTIPYEVLTGLGKRVLRRYG